MAFGFRIATTKGMSDLSDIRSLRMVWSGSFNTVSGSTALPTGMGTGSIVSVEVHDDKEEPNITLASNSLSWSSGANTTYGQSPSTNFTISLYRIR